MKEKEMIVWMVKIKNGMIWCFINIYLFVNVNVFLKVMLMFLYVIIRSKGICILVYFKCLVL